MLLERRAIGFQADADTTTVVTRVDVTGQRYLEPTIPMRRPRGS